MRVRIKGLRVWGSAFAFALAAATLPQTAIAQVGDAATAPPPTLRVQGSRLVDGSGQLVQLRGANRAVFESRCTYDASGVADGPVDQASVGAMLAWKMNAVRVTLNEDCWLGINGLPLGGGAAAYRAAVIQYVQLLRRNGLYVILTPHFTAPGSFQSNSIDNMPDADHLPTFWRQVATDFKTDHGLIFDLVNEVGMASYNIPHPNPPGEWACWLNGCVLDSVYPQSGPPARFHAAGMQTLVNAVRGAGANQPLLLGGLAYNSDLTQLLTHLPADPKGQLIASPHFYDFVQGLGGTNAAMSNPVEVIAKEIPVVIGELGERYCDSGTGAYTQHVLGLIDAASAKGLTLGVLGWTWNAHTAQSTGWHCPTGPYGDGGPLMIRNYAGAPTVMGAVFRKWFLKKAAVQ